MKPRRLLSFCLVPTLIVTLSVSAQAKFGMGEDVPVDRLINNVMAQQKRTPNDPAVLYMLGRLHSLAFAQGNKPVNVFLPGKSRRTSQTIPEFSAYDQMHVKPDATLAKRKAPALSHLKTSLQLYRRVVTLKPNEALYWYSYGWMLEQGTPFASETNAPFLAKPGKVAKPAWRDETLKAYRRAFSLSKDADLKREHILEGADVIVSYDAGKSILALMKNRSLNAAEREETADIEAHLKQMDARPHAVTPLVFPLNGEQSLAELTQNPNPVRFDLASEAVPRLWHWVTPQAGILVWDPKQTGAIASGRQLFGSVTWWIFWKNGFEPLAALDDNKDGVLEGAELAGIAVWQDKDGNGRSDVGEVTPLGKWGVKQIAVRPGGMSEGVPFHSQGIVLQDGSTRPLYDWMPTSVPEKASSSQ